MLTDDTGFVPLSDAWIINVANEIHRAMPDNAEEVDEMLQIARAVERAAYERAAAHVRTLKRDRCEGVSSGNRRRAGEGAGMSDQTKGYLPNGCRCDPRDWYPLDAPVPGVCADFAAYDGGGDCADWLIEVWPHLHESAQTIIRRDVEKAFESDDRQRAGGMTYKALGADCDRQQWDRVRRLWDAEARG